MKIEFFFMLMFVGANCLRLPPNILKEILENSRFSVSNHKLLTLLYNSTNNLKTSVNQLSASVDGNKKYFSDLMESNLDELQKNLTERTEQIVGQKFTSISKDLQNSSLDMIKMQTSFNQLSNSVANLSESVADIKTYIINKEPTETLPTCYHAYNLGENVSASNLLQNFEGKPPICDMETDGGEWLVVQQRKEVTNQVDFNRDWLSYKEGFGDFDTEFWIGNEYLHRITNHQPYELRIDMEDFENGTAYATYSEFQVGNEESGYQLHIGGYQGNVTDSLKYLNNEKFTTFDSDNDNWIAVNCAKKHSGGFWYWAFCTNANLNGMFPTDPDRENEQLIQWWTNEEKPLILIKVEMKIRPKKNKMKVIEQSILENDTYDYEFSY